MRRSIGRLALGFHRRAVQQLPHPDKPAPGGEDSYLTSSNALGVFDGVGSWARLGVDAGAYSRTLAKHIYEYISEETAAGGDVNVRAALRYGEESTRDVKGSSTAVLALLSDDVLHFANLGDSAGMVIRDGKIVFRTRSQQHELNHPYQMGTDAATTWADAEVSSMSARDGDVVVLGSDGVFDNLFDDEIAGLLLESLVGRAVVDAAGIHGQGQALHMTRVLYNAAAKHVADGEHEAADLLQRALTRILLAARERSIDEVAETPIGVQCREEGLLLETAGKLDDETIVVGIAQNDCFLASGERVNDRQVPATRPYIGCPW